MLHFFRAIILIAAFALPFHIALAADWEGVYEGNLGKAKIIAQLVEPLGDMEGETKRETSRYSYLPKIRDINLMLADDKMPLKFDETALMHWEFNEPPDGDKKITGKWSVTVKGDEAKGTWTSPDGKKVLPITLKRVPWIADADKDPDDNFMNATYVSLWAKTVKFSDIGVAKKFGEIELRNVKDSAFGVVFPVLSTYPDRARKDKINSLLIKQYRRSVEQYRECKNGVPNAWAPETEQPEYSFEVAYASSTVLSLIESGSVFCGGAHPSNYVDAKSYDLLAVEQMGGPYELDLSPQGFGRMLKLANKDERIAFETFALGRWTEAQGEDGGACSNGWIEDYAPGEKNFSLYFSEKGLAVHRTDFPHVASDCQFTDTNPTTIPWADLKAFLKPGQKLVSVP